MYPNNSKYRECSQLLRQEFGIDLLGIEDIYRSEISKFGSHLTLPMIAMPRLIGGSPCPANCSVTVKVSSFEHGIVVKAIIDEGVTNEDVSRFDTLDSGSSCVYIIACTSAGARERIRLQLRVKKSPDRIKSKSWMASLELVQKWFEYGEEVSCFIDAFAAMGFRRATTAVKLSSLCERADGSPPVRTVMEWRGDEAASRYWLPMLDSLLVNTVNVRFIICDQKAAHYVLGTPGSKSDFCFLFSRIISREMWRNVPSMPLVSGFDTDDLTQLMFSAVEMQPTIPRFLAGAAAAVPLMHCFQNVMQYVINTGTTLFLLHTRH